MRWESVRWKKQSRPDAFCLDMPRELRIAIVPYSPTAHGFFAGKAVVESVPTDSFLLKPVHVWMCSNGVKFGIFKFFHRLVMIQGNKLCSSTLLYDLCLNTFSSDSSLHSATVADLCAARTRPQLDFRLT
ncbi:Serine acetyltransferase 5 [Camellia lanceoleosa]|uniref:Serine acetyltransferase 5 n=1 Tax=Camellia lanceoleosa TaxID=1840588 RepID=A0ACC0IFB9_9ERIC|nr:Serine acetyltransferase 5 [Camellia lanceoleosa]